MGSFLLPFVATFILLQSATTFAHKSSQKVHNCVHDTLEPIVITQNVKYNNHPYDSFRHQSFANITNRRELISQELSQSAQPIRISPYYDPSTITTENGQLATAQITYIKRLVSASIRHMQSVISVIPVDGPLFLHKCSGWVWSQQQPNHKIQYHLCSAASTPTNPTCGSSTFAVAIPDQHLGETWLYDNEGQSTLDQAAGTGIADTDLVIYITYDDSAVSCNGQTLAFATQCRTDQFGRPIAGIINFCAKTLEDQYWKFDVTTTLHELTHVLVFNSGQFSTFYDPNTLAFRENVVVEYGDNSYVTTAKVKEIARAHFGCETLIGAPLENAGSVGTVGSHWEGKHLNFEYMTGTGFSAMVYVSKFTLALMEDSGWYQIDWNYAQTFVWGQSQGCDFITDACVDPESSTSNYPQYWCDSLDDDGCTADHKTIGSCLLSVDGTVPAKFKYYSDDLAGHESTDYCGFINPPTTNEDFEPICWDERGNTLDASSIGASTYWIDSRCVDTLASDGTTHKGYCFKHICTGFNAVTSSYSAVVITVNTAENITCLVSDALTTKSVATVSGLESITCPEVDVICGSTTSPFACFFGEYNQELSECVCSAGYTGTQCGAEDNDLIEEASAGAGVVDIADITPTHTSICVSGIADANSKWLNGVYAKMGDSDSNEGYPAYFSQSVGNGVYVYYQRSGANWRFGAEKGSALGYGECKQFVDENTYPNIVDCAPWYIFNQAEMVLEAAVSVTYDDENCGSGDGSDDSKANGLWRNIWMQCLLHILSICYIF